MAEHDCTPERCSCANDLELCDGCACFREGYEASGFTCERADGGRAELAAITHWLREEGGRSVVLPDEDRLAGVQLSFAQLRALKQRIFTDIAAALERGAHRPEGVEPGETLDDG